MVDVGLYFDLRNPRQWERPWSHVYGRTIELVEEAERLGCRSAWFSEHHLFDDGYLTQPLTYMAAVAARTSTIRLGTAIMIGPLREPALVAEETTVVDLISNGRVEIGVGAGYRSPEFDLYNMTLDKRYDRNDQLVRELRRFWREGVLTPPPVQAEIPIWMGYQGPRGARRAGVLGEGLMSVDCSLLEPYYEGLEAGGHDRSTARTCGNVSIYATRDPERDWPKLAPHVAYWADSYRAHAVRGTDFPMPGPVDPERMRAKPGIVSGFRSISVATPEVIAEQIRELVRDTPAKTVFTFVDPGGGLSDEMVVEHIRCLIEDVAPLVADA